MSVPSVPNAALPLPPAAALARPGERRAGAAQALCLIATGTMPVLAVMSLVPVLPMLLAHFASEAQGQWLVPMILTVPSIIVVIFSSLMGSLADRWGRRRLVLASLVAFALLGVLPAWLDSLYAILATRLVVGLAEAGILTSVNALMGDYFEGAEREKWLGRQVMLGPLIGAAYVLAGGALGSINWHAPFLMYLLGVPLLAWAGGSLWEPLAPTPQAGASAAEAAPFPWRVTLRISAVTIVVTLFFFLQLVQHGRIFSALGVTSAGQIGLFVTIAGLGHVVGGFLFSRVGRWQLGQQLTLLFTLIAIGYIGLSMSRTVWIGLFFDIVAMVGGGLVVPTLLSWALAQYPFEQRGRGMGIWNGCFSLSQFLSPALVTVIGLAAGGFMTTIGVFGAIAALLAVLSWLGGSRLATFSER